MMKPKEKGRLGGIANRDGHLSLCPVCGRPMKNQYLTDTGQMGGEATLKKHGRQFYVNIGKLGGRGNTRERGLSTGGKK